MRYSFNRLVLVAALIALAAPCFAQFGGSSSSGVGGGRRGSRSPDGGFNTRSPDAEANLGVRGQNIGDKLLEVRLRLALSQGQGPAWDNFNTKAMAWSAAVARGRSYSTDTTAPLWLQQRLTDTQNRYASMEALSDAFKALYAQLSPDQQRTLDQALPSVVP